MCLFQKTTARCVSLLSRNSDPAEDVSKVQESRFHVFHVNCSLSFLWKCGKIPSFFSTFHFFHLHSLLQRIFFSSLIECYKTINRLNGLDLSAFFTFAHDFRPLRANHRFKFKLSSAILNSFKHSFFIGIIHKWNNLPKEVAEAENLNIFKSRLRRYLTDFPSEH